MSTSVAPARKTQSALKVGHVHRAWAIAASDPVPLFAGVLTLLLLGWLLLRLPYPVSGSDGGNWLALSGGLMGIRANAAATVYPPGFLVLLVAIRSLMPPIEALRVAAALVALLPGIGCYLLLRAMRLRRIALVGVLFPLLGYPSEMIAWGGYPQLMGTGLVLIACAALLRGYRTDRLGYFMVCGAFAGLSVLTHQLAGLQALIALPVMSGLVLLANPHVWLQRIKQWTVTALVLAMVALPAVPVYIELIARAGTHAFNAQDQSSFGAMFDYLTYDTPLIWRVVGPFVPLALLVRGLQRAWIDVAVIFGLLVASLGLTLATFEVRAMFVGLLVGYAATCIAFSDLMRMNPGGWRLALAGTACTLWVTLIVAGQQRFAFTLRYYTSLDQFVAEGLQWLGHQARPGDLAVSVASKEKWPLGWWVQGLGHVPSYLAYDSRWLYFREEKEQALIARSILDNDDPQRAAAEAQQYGVTLLIFDTRDVNQADVWLHSGRVNGQIGLVYSNPSLAIFRVDQPPKRMTP
jgi:hypothetical protein